MPAIFWFAIRQNLRLRRLWFVLLLLAGPSAIALLIRRFAHSVEIEDYWDRYHSPMVYMLFMVVLPLVCMLCGSALIGSEADGRTLVYQITRRSRRETVLWVRFAAVWLTLTILAVLAVTAYHFCTVGGLDIEQLNDDGGWANARAWHPWQDLLGYLQTTPFAIAAFLGIFTLVSLVFRRPMVVSLIYLVLFEMGVGNAPMQAQIYTITHQLKRMMNASIPHLLDLFAQSHGRAIVKQLYPPGRSGVIPLLIVTLLALILASIAMRSRELLPAKTTRE